MTQLIIVHPESHLNKLVNGVSEYCKEIKPDKIYLIEQFGEFGRLFNKNIIDVLAIDEENIGYSPHGWFKLRGQREGQAPQDVENMNNIYKKIISEGSEIVLMGSFLGNRFFQTNEYAGHETNGCVGRALMDMVEGKGDLEIYLPKKFVFHNKTKLCEGDLTLAQYLAEKGYSISENEDFLLVQPTVKVQTAG